MLPELLASHPNALVIQSLREPAKWKQSRIKKHVHQGAADWHQAGICGKADHPMNHSMTELDYVLYNAWAHCIAPKSGRPNRYVLQVSKCVRPNLCGARYIFCLQTILFCIVDAIARTSMFGSRK
jgi:hypothetical protein